MNWSERLKFRHLRLLVTLHETRNLTMAADRMSMTQPALSKWLKELEDDLGFPLFVRHVRGILPTSQGEVLVATAKVILNELERTAGAMELMSAGLQGKVHIGITPVAEAELIPVSITSFMKDFPGATVNVTGNYLDALLPQLMDGRLDFVVSRLEDLDYSGELSQERLYAEKIAVVCNKKHPLLRKRTLGWQDMLQYPWIGPPRNSPLYRELQHELALANLPLPRIVVEGSSTILLTSILERSEMLSMVSSRTARYFVQSGRLSTLKFLPRRVNYVGVLRRKGRALDPLAEGYLNALRTANSLTAP
ncbi:MAG: LysR substrate-binding domain-containing protein [Pseudomonadota bacterium]